jgi:dipeptide/tripeptide permease
MWRSFGRQDCFSIAFGIPAILMLVAMAIFYSGRSSYIIKSPTGENLVVKTAKCIGSALKNKFRATRHQRIGNHHWLDFASEKYSTEFVDDVKSVLSVLRMFIPLPIFWSLYDQQGSRWTQQAKLMNGNITLFGHNFLVKPDQMQVCNAVLILALIPLFEKCIYPAISRAGFRFRPLQRMAVGMLFVGLSFCLAGLVQLMIENNGQFKANSVGDKQCVDGCVSLMWQVPQYVVITIAEVIFSITGLEFTYSQAPSSMKSVCQACWSLTVALGNVVVRMRSFAIEHSFNFLFKVIFVAESKLFPQSVEPFFFSLLTLMSLFVFMLLSMTYTYKEDKYDVFCEREVEEEVTA